MRIFLLILGGLTWAADKDKKEMGEHCTPPGLYSVGTIKFVPNMAPGGKTDGFKVVSLTDDSGWARIGVKANDVAVQINGFPLNTSNAVTESVSMGPKDVFIVDVKRNGALIRIKYECK